MLNICVLWRTLQTKKYDCSNSPQFPPFGLCNYSDFKRHTQQTLCWRLNVAMSATKQEGPLIWVFTELTVTSQYNIICMLLNSCSSPSKSEQCNSQNIERTRHFFHVIGILCQPTHSKKEISPWDQKISLCYSILCVISVFELAHVLHCNYSFSPSTEFITLPPKPSSVQLSRTQTHVLPSSSWNASLCWEIIFKNHKKFKKTMLKTEAVKDSVLRKCVTGGQVCVYIYMCVLRTEWVNITTGPWSTIAGPAATLNREMNVVRWQGIKGTLVKQCVILRCQNYLLSWHNLIFFSSLQRIDWKKINQVLIKVRSII